VDELRAGLGETGRGWRVEPQTSVCAIALAGQSRTCADISAAAANIDSSICSAPDAPAAEKIVRVLTGCESAGHRRRRDAPTDASIPRPGPARLTDAINPSRGGRSVGVLTKA